MKDYWNFLNESKKNEFSGILDKLGKDLKKSAISVKQFLHDPDNKKHFLSGKSSDDIKIDVVEIKACELKPSQQQIYMNKVLGQVVCKKRILNGFLNDYADIPKIYISENNHIIDGHHKWSAIYMLNPDCIIKCHQIKLPIEAAIPIFNTILYIENPDGQGYTGKDSMNLYNINDIDLFESTLKDIVDEGYIDDDGIRKYPNDKFVGDPKKLLHIIRDSKIGEKNKLENKKDVIQYLFNNMKNIPKTGPKFGERNQMPQFGDVEDEVMKNLQNGKYDVKNIKW